MKMHAKKTDRNERIIEMYMEGYSLSMIVNTLNLTKGIVNGVIKCHAKDKTNRQPVKYQMARKKRNEKQIVLKVLEEEIKVAKSVEEKTLLEALQLVKDYLEDVR